MSSLREQFLSRFSMLGGITIGERRKQLFILLKEVSPILSTDPVILDDVISNLEPKSYLEHKFRVEVLIKFRRFPELLEILTSDNEPLMYKLWRQKCFFQYLLKTMESHYIVEDICSKLSFVIRMRLLETLVKNSEDNESKMDEVYDTVKTKYGLHIASKIVAGCTANKILNILSEHRVQFSCKHVKILIKKYKNDKAILVNILKMSNSASDEDLMKIIASADLELFFILFDDEPISRVDFGKRLTRRVIEQRKDEVLSDVEKYKQLLKLKTLVKALKSDFRHYFCKLFPKNVDDLYHIPYSVTYYKKENQLELVNEALRINYNKTLADLPILIEEKLLSNVTDASLREQLVEAKLKEDKDNTSLIKFFRIEKSVPMLKKKINLANRVQTRESLISVLVETCKVNNDLNALLEIEEYFFGRHRNDDETIRDSFLNNINDNFNMVNLNDKHWDYINKLLELKSIKHEMMWSVYKIFIKYMDFLISKGQSCDDEMFNHVKRFGSNVNHWGLKHASSKLEKMLLITLIEKVPEVLDKHEKVELYDVALFKAILSWNKRHPNDLLNVFDYARILNSLSINFKSKRSDLTDELKYFINMRHSEHPFIEEAKTIYWTLIYEYSEERDVINYFIKREPMYILRDFDKFVDYSFGSWRLSENSNLWQLIKQYTHLELPQRIIKELLEKLNKQELGSYGYIILANMLDAEQLVSTVLPYAPDHDKMSASDDNVTGDYNTKVAVAKSLKYANSYLVLPILADFCQGDYLGTALESLYYLCYHIAENRLYSLIEELGKRAVSVRKHAIKLTCKIGSLANVFNLSKAFTVHEKNSSVRQHLFASTYKYFTRNPSDEFWELIHSQMALIDIEDKESFSYIIQLSGLPEKYKAPHIIFTWNLLKSLKSKGGNVTSYQQSILSSAASGEIIRTLPYEFCANIVKEIFMSIDDNDFSESQCNSFVNSFILHGMDKQLTITMVFGMLSNLKNRYWSHEDILLNSKARRCIYSFISSFISECEWEKHLEQRTIECFFSEWKKFFTPTESFDEYLMITLLIIYKEGDEISTTALKISVLLQEMIAQFGILIFEKFVSILSSSITTFFIGKGDQESNLLAFCGSLLSSNASVYDFLLIIKLLPAEVPKDEDDQRLFLNLISKLRSIDDVMVQIYFNVFLKCLE